MDEIEMFERTTTPQVVTPSCSLEDDYYYDDKNNNRIKQQSQQKQFCQMIDNNRCSTTSNDYWLNKLYSGCTITNVDWTNLSNKMVCFTYKRNNKKKTKTQNTNHFFLFQLMTNI
jgi:hypothetical protein